MVSSEECKKRFILSGGTVYAFPLCFYTASDIVCYLYDPDAGTESELVRNRDYSVEVKDDYSSGANITLITGGSTSVFAEGIPTGNVLSILRELDYTQDTALPLHGKLPSTSVERQMDRIVMQVQQIVEVGDRSLKVPHGSTATESGEVVEAVMEAKDAAVTASTVALSASTAASASAAAAARSAEEASKGKYSGSFLVDYANGTASIAGGVVRRGVTENTVSAGTCTCGTNTKIYLVARYNTTTYNVTYLFQAATSISSISCPSGYTQYCHRLAVISGGTASQSQFGDIVVTGVWI